jgi:hypothetical protein
MAIRSCRRSSILLLGGSRSVLNWKQLHTSPRRKLNSNILFDIQRMQI